MVCGLVVVVEMRLVLIISVSVVLKEQGIRNVHQQKRTLSCGNGENY
jgi:hypothetical protein